MIVFRLKTAEDMVQINFCSAGLYIQIGDDNGDSLEMKNCIIEHGEDLEELIKYINEYK